MTYVPVSVPRPANNAGRGITPKDVFSIIDVDDILSFPPRDENGVVLVGDIILKPGKYAVNIYITPGTVEMTSNSDGETDGEGFTPTVKGNHPGKRREIREFKTNWLGRQCITLLNYCNGDPTDISGSPCNPMKMSVTYTGNSDTNSSGFTFTQISRGDDIGIYEGSIPEEEPVAVVAAAASEIAYVGPGQYQLSPGAAAIATVSGATHGALLTILGVTSGEAPTISSGSGSSFMLKNGKTFTGSTGSQITFRAFADSDSTYKFIEQSRFEA